MKCRFWVITAILLAVISASSFYSVAEEIRTSDRDVQTLLSDADGYMSEKKWDKALEVFDQIFELDPSNETALLRAAFINFQVRKDSEKAYGYAKRLLEINPENYLALVILGHCHVLRGEIDTAIGCFERSVAINPSDEDSLTMLGMLELNYRDDPKKAVGYFERAYAVNPAGIETLINLAGIYLDIIKDLDKAAKYAEEVIALDEGNYMAWVILGEVSIKKNEMDKALECFDKAVKMSPNEITYYAIGLCYEKMGELDKAKEALETAREMNKDDNFGVDIDAALGRVTNADV